MSTTFVSHRLDVLGTAPRQAGGLVRLGRSVELDHTLRHLIDVRASQLNGCAFCLDMHWKDARAAGETEERLYSLSTWREATVYDERERAALALCEEVTRLPDAGVSDAVWDAAAAVFEPGELAQVLFAIAVINTWNRIQVASGAEPGHYVPGAFDEA
ncbi:carboxymuconolactone decarboxylase family protein [Conexibacter sp. SYSU D00693]|uniref:carboxymuconolactone decarboxylase family protein n=1 Tax=Conexibacter sp. SYSU D00693 TaxID=2812560 RepID=UPI00196A4C89|nr:carboxymuconolactone decarboxylase family protein [Conexibacter sp. SYSU D00693]